MKVLPCSMWIPLGAVIALAGCSKYYYNPSPQIMPQHVRKLAIREFNNRSDQQVLPQKLNMAIHSALNRDGRWEIVEEANADGVLMGEITRYMLIPTKHDANHVTSEYKLWMLVDISLFDRVKQQTLWTERNLEYQLIFPRTSTGEAGGLMQTEAQDKACEQLAKDIAKRTFEGFGTVTGASEKAVPQFQQENTRMQPAPSF